MAPKRLTVRFHIPPTRKVKVVYFRSNTPPEQAARNGETAYGAVIDRPQSMGGLECQMLKRHVPLRQVLRVEPVVCYS